MGGLWTGDSVCHCPDILRFVYHLPLSFYFALFSVYTCWEIRLVTVTILVTNTSKTSYHRHKETDIIHSRSTRQLSTYGKFQDQIDNPAIHGTTGSLLAYISWTWDTWLFYYTYPWISLRLERLERALRRSGLLWVDHALSQWKPLIHFEFLGGDLSQNNSYGETWTYQMIFQRCRYQGRSNRGSGSIRSEQWCSGVASVSHRLGENTYPSISNCDIYSQRHRNLLEE